MKTKNILLAFGILALIVFGVAQIPTILPVSPVTEFVDFLKGMRATGPLEVGPVGRNLKTWWRFEDFIGFGGFWNGYQSGAGASAYILTGTATRPGALIFLTGTTTTGYAAVAPEIAFTTILFGAGIYTIEADISIVTLSTATEAYALRFGFGDSLNADFVDGAYFEYSDVGSTPNWYKCTASNSTRTKTDTTVVTTTGIARLKVVVNIAGTSVEFFINGISAGVVTTNIPTGAGRETGMIFHVVKSAGTTGRYFSSDWIWVHVNLAESR